MTRTPLGQPLTRDVRRSGNSVLASCQVKGGGLVLVETGVGTLSFEGLHMTVTPRGPSLLERVTRALGVTEMLEQDLDLLAKDCDGWAAPLALLGPLALLRLDRDEAVCGDAVLAAQPPEGDVGGDVLALKPGKVVTLVHGDRLSAVPAPAAAG